MKMSHLQLMEIIKQVRDVLYADDVVDLYLNNR